MTGSVTAIPMAFPRVIDYLSIDTVGTEWETLRNFDFGKYRFLTATVEHNYFRGAGLREKCTEKRDKIRKLLSSNGCMFRTPDIGLEMT